MFPILFVTILLVFSQVANSVGHISATDHTEADQNGVHASVPPPISDHRFFLHEIFTKYGRDGQMTFEGFEHLLESLGLGNIIINDHNIKDHKDGESDNLHGSHDHSKKSDHDHDESPSPTRGSGLGHQHEIQKHIHSHPTQATKSSTRLPLNSLEHQGHQNNIVPTPTHSDYHHVTVNSKPTTKLDHQTNENVFNYRLREVKIPELLVNISTLVEQHQELEERVPEYVVEQCLSPREILATFGINQTSSLNPVSFLHLCPAIIYELDQGHCMLGNPSHKSSRSIATLDQWLYSCVAVLVISLCGLLSVAVIPIMQKWFYHTLLQFFVGLAVGSLSGDALLHLLPHAMLGGAGSHDHTNMSGVALEKMAVWRGFAALVGVFFFFLAERFLGNYAAYRKQKKERKASRSPRPQHNGVHSNDASLAGSVGEKLSQYRKSSYRIETTEKEMINMLNADTLSSRKASVESLPGLEMSFSLRPMGLSPAPSPPVTVIVPEHQGHGHSHEVPDSVTAVAWMVIMGDGLHNFCDGLAIGAAFASGIEGGISTTVAVFCHELPHELGDFAMLLKTGMTVKQAMLYNGLSSILCFVGMVIGVALGNVESATSWVFAGTAGMFLYIALVDMLPELTAPGDPDFPVSYQLSVQMLGICFGVSIMLVIANFEQDLQNLIS
ncbi:hypothetical protein JTE90_012306 [Oedothorax gibbosus]|uniref:Zinc transporter ZIP10 n=1 Tax=Oedothorax gibbosus TaxID=931172 RepID=A0AAV6VKC5_9ARAC|nr:hypothetical protein JTE90_012306 [Oedothorax gibbosus]